jgi:hypothetical protein
MVFSNIKFINDISGIQLTFLWNDKSGSIILHKGRHSFINIA